MDLWTYEREQWNSGLTALCGVDEAGAGPLAGPVYAAAVILPREIDLPGLNDSKKLTAKKRDVLFDQITAAAEAYSIAFVTAEADTGPARGPAPAPSTPQRAVGPVFHC